MISVMFAVFDSAIKAYANPVFLQSRGEAIRGFIEIVNDPKSKFFKFPEDFTLFELGTYDDSSGLVTSLTTPYSLGNALQFMNKSPLNSSNENSFSS
jgi:hypothetical protein